MFNKAEPASHSSIDLIETRFRYLIKALNSKQPHSINFTLKLENLNRTDNKVRNCGEAN